jgi:syntaxin-binding protein 1
VNLFPYIKDAPVDATLPPNMRSTNAQVQQGSSLRTARPTWHKAPSMRMAAATEQRQRIIIFVAGGITYSEQRMAYLVGKALKKDVIIGMCSGWFMECGAQ